MTRTLIGSQNKEAIYICPHTYTINQTSRMQTIVNICTKVIRLFSVDTYEVTLSELRTPVRYFIFRNHHNIYFGIHSSYVQTTYNKKFSILLRALYILYTSNNNNNRFVVFVPTNLQDIRTQSTRTEVPNNIAF